MIELQPTYRIFLPPPILGRFADNAPFIPVLPADNGLIFEIRSLVPRSLDLGWYYYVCMSALAVNGREEDCRTPPFRPEIVNDRRCVPEFVTDWMHGFAKVMQIGASYGRAHK